MADRTPTDGELLTAYVAQRSDDAFAELLNRHGRLVLNVCLRVLRNKQDAEDAAQAVFLVLADKANSLRSYLSVAGWLHRVAWNVAQNARNAQAARKRHEQEAGAMTTSDSAAPSEWQELAPVLDEELNALPTKTRDAILLFHLEGRTLEETAKALDCPTGTLGARLSRGREVLRERLARRGMILSTGLIVLMLDKNASAAELSADFAKTTLKAAHALASGQTGWESLVSPQTHSLTQGALSMFRKARLRILTLAVATAALFLITLGNYSFKAGAAETKSDIAKAAVTPPIPAPAPKAPEEPVAPVKVSEWIEPANIAESNTRFSLDLYGKLAAGEKGNFFISPFSIQTALAMTYAGAQAETATDMAHALHFPLDRKKMNADFAKLLKTINTPKLARDKKPVYQLSTANALWCQQDYPFKQDFLDLNKNTYGGGANLVNFKQKITTAKTINDWVAQKTQDKIQNLILPVDIEETTRLVLTNAIYFKSKWADEFTTSETQNKPFTLEDGTKVNVPMMQQFHSYTYAETESCQVISIPYESYELSMMIVLPRKAGGLAEFERTLTQKSWDALLSRLKEHNVTLSLPKFKNESKFDLKDVLIKLGMERPFDGLRANFSGITAAEKLCIAKVIHKSFVDVNEEGTEAAAATAVMMKPGGIRMDDDPKTFNADHPFLYLIRHEATKTILFMGRMANPKG